MKAESTSLLQQVLLWLESQLLTWWQAIELRLAPLIEQLAPIWQDPLWQGVALALAIIFATPIARNFLKRAASVSKSVITPTYTRCWQYFSAMVNTVRTAVKWLYARATHQLPFWLKRIRLDTTRAWQLLKYLSTSKEWRYQLPWYLVYDLNAEALQNPPVNSWFQQLVKQQKSRLQAKEKALRLPSSSWCFLEHGVLIRPSCMQQAPPDQAKVSSFLHSLLAHRPEKPLDGIVVSINARQLQSSEQARALGAKLNQGLWHIQKSCGFNLPVYLMFEGCESIRGFNSFCASLTPEQRQQILGWSNPRKLDAAYNGQWVREAFDSICCQLQQKQLNTAGSGAVIEDIDGFLLFENALKGLEQTTTECLNQAFKSNGYQESQPLRGIYFCGLTHSGKQQPEMAFVEQLFSHKVLAERDLAKPINKSVFSYQPLLKQVQVASLIFAALSLMWIAVDIGRLIHNEQQHNQLMQQLSRIKPDCDTNGLASQRLLAKLSDFAHTPVYVSLPLSWFISDRQEQDFVAENVLAKALFTAMECRFKAKAEHINQRLSAQKVDSSSYRQNTRQLQDFADTLSEYYQNRQRFLTLSGALSPEYPAAEALLKLYNYLYHNPLPAGTNLNRPLVNRALQQMEYQPDLVRLQQPLISQQQVSEFVLQRSQAIQQQLLQYATSPWKDTLQGLYQQPVSRDRLKPLQASAMPPLIHQAVHWFAQTADDWLSGYYSSPCFTLSERLQRLSKTLKHIGFNLETLTTSQALFSEQDCYQQVQQALLASKLATGDALYKKVPIQGSKNSLLMATPEQQHFLQQLEAMSQLTFMQQTFPAVVTTSEPVIGWHLQPLQNAIQILVDYQAFMHKFPDGRYLNRLKQRAQEASFRLINQSMQYSSQQPYQYLTTEQQVLNQVDNLQQVRASLLDLQHLLQQLQLNDTRLSFQQVLDKQLYALLDKLDSLVNERQVYAAEPVPDWQQPDFARALFKPVTPKQRADYLQDQAQRLAYLANSYAQPVLVTLLNRDGALHHPVAARWYQTMQTLDEVERKVPDNGQMRLTRFIQQILPDLNQSNCLSLKTDENNWQPGWHGQRLAELTKTVEAYCQGATRSIAARDFLDLADAFNRLLAGRFPFAPVEKAGKTELTMAQLQQFIDTFQQINARDQQTSLPQRISALAQRYPEQVPPSWLDFVNQLSQFITFMQPRLNNGELQVELAVQFSPNTTLGTEHILRWSVASGQYQARFPNGNNTLQWQAGQALTLTMRWANGSPYQPSAGGDPFMRLNSDQLTLNVSATGNWGLFEWMARYSEVIPPTTAFRRLWFYPVLRVKQQADAQPLVLPTNIALAAVGKEQNNKFELIPTRLPHSAPGLFSHKP